MYTAVSDMQNLELKREADCNDITDSADITECCSHDYKPTVGMFVCCFSSRQLFLGVCCLNKVKVKSNYATSDCLESARL